ncbi:MAG: aminoacyl-tRNA hydrolase, partial [Candidatus Brocadiaceae bacterium]
MKIIAALGNPGPRYSNTRHNAGWMAADRLADLCGMLVEDCPHNGALARSGELIVFKPSGYMNRSGPP